MLLQDCPVCFVVLAPCSLSHLSGRLSGPDRQPCARRYKKMENIDLGDGSGNNTQTRNQKGMRRPIEELAKVLTLTNDKVIQDRREKRDRGKGSGKKRRCPIFT